MPDHFHFVTDGKRSPSETLRYLNGVTAKRILDYLKENEFTSSLLKLREAVKERGYKHSVWGHRLKRQKTNGELYCPCLAIDFYELLRSFGADLGVSIADGFSGLRRIFLSLQK